MSSNNKRIVLGYPLDLLFNRNCFLSDYITALKKHDELIKVPDGFENIRDNGRGGIILPSDDNPGTGNIVIRGKPGTAKSTLALQVAIAATLNQEIDNSCLSIYLSLEESPDNVKTKADLFGWAERCKVVKHLEDLSELSSIKDYAEELRYILSQPEECRVITSKNCDNHNLSEITSVVLLPMLTPINLFQTEQQGDSLYLERYKQIENILSAARYAGKDDTKFPRIAFVIIDSVNVFGNKPLTREELNRLFLMFKQYKVIGIFIVEDEDFLTVGAIPEKFNDAIDYLADVVISLSSDFDDGYFVRYFEIKKSRYQHQVYGKHPYRLNNIKKSQTKSFKEGITIFPSLHYIVFGTNKLLDDEST